MTAKDSIGTLFFKEKQIRLITTLLVEKEWHIADLAKETGVTYIHTSNFINRCEKRGLIESEKHGRIKRISLTEKGIEIAKGISLIAQKLDSYAKPVPQEQQPAGSDR